MSYQDVMGWYVDPDDPPAPAAPGACQGCKFLMIEDDAGVYTFRNGDPGYPGSYDEVCVNPYAPASTLFFRLQEQDAGQPAYCPARVPWMVSAWCAGCGRPVYRPESEVLCLFDVDDAMHPICSEACRPAAQAKLGAWAAKRDADRRAAYESALAEDQAEAEAARKDQAAYWLSLMSDEGQTDDED